ncbi:hypothetical protein OC845_006039 [Tilletia horrida]|nr:hypothetical protein OC845_006039 [Tilletia horrida]
MTAVLSAYSAQLRGSLPDIDNAKQNFKRFGGLAKVQDALADVADQHPSSNKFGLQLLHRHSKLVDGEIMIENGPTTHPFLLSDLSAAARNSLRATVWGISPVTKKFTPLQFAFEEHNGQSMDELDAALAEAVAAILIHHGLEHVFGLATTDPDQEMMIEITSGRAEILIPATKFLETKAGVETLWPLSKIGRGGTAALCATQCAVDPKDGRHKTYHVSF